MRDAARATAKMLQARWEKSEENFPMDFAAGAKIASF